MTEAQIKQFFLSKGWKSDRFGHMKKTTSDGRLYRIKFQATSIRWEVQCVHPNDKFTPSSWVRLYTGFFKQLSISADGKLVGMKKWH